MSALVRDVGARLGQVAVSATVAVEGSEIVTTPARPGRIVNRGALTTALATLPPSVVITTREGAPAGR